MLARRFSAGWLRSIATALYLGGMLARLAWLRLRHRRALLILLRAGGLGDIVAAIPAINALRGQFPARHLVFCTRPEFCGIGELIHAIDTTLPTLHSDRFAVLASRWCDARRLRYLDEYLPAGSTAHFVDEMAASVDAELPPGALPRIEVEPMSDGEFADFFGVAPGTRKVVALHAGPTAPVKEWSHENWTSVARRLAGEWDAIIVQIGVGRHFQHGGSERVIEGALRAARALSIAESARLLKRCALFVGIDSGPLHLAAAVGTRAVGLFGPVDPALRLPGNARAVTAEPRLPCQFCHHRLPRGHWETGCPHDTACMRQLLPERVIAALEESAISISR